MQRREMQHAGEVGHRWSVGALARRSAVFPLPRGGWGVPGTHNGLEEPCACGTALQCSVQTPSVEARWLNRKYPSALESMADEHWEKVQCDER